MEDIAPRLRWKAMRAIKDGDYRHLHEVRGAASMAYQLRAISLEAYQDITYILDAGPEDKAACAEYCRQHPECGTFISWSKPGKQRRTE